MTASFNILHVLRAPVGGLFRHVADLARAQSTAGHRVGVLCCSEAADRLTEERLARLSGDLALGLSRVAMAREMDWRDVTATRATIAHAQRLGIDVLHGHGAKGGAYARLAAGRIKRSRPYLLALYTPHGGSLHYAPDTLKGRIFMGLERHLAASTDGIVFESAYSAKIYENNVHPRGAMETRIIPNGVGPNEFDRVAPAPNAADFVFVGELRHLKGVDLMLEALARIDTPRAPSAVIVGDGPDAERFKQQVEKLGLAARVSFPGALPARTAFALGRSLVMPSRAESFPYIVLEAGAAGLPMIATSVGGIPEITTGTSMSLVPSEDIDALAVAMHRHLVDRSTAEADAESLQRAIAARFTITAMSATILSFYRQLAFR